MVCTTAKANESNWSFRFPVCVSLSSRVSCNLSRRTAQRHGAGSCSQSSWLTGRLAFHLAICWVYTCVCVRERENVCFYLCILLALVLRALLPVTN